MKAFNELCQAVEFLDRVEASSPETRAAVRNDHWEWLARAAKKAAKAWKEVVVRRRYRLERARRLIRIYDDPAWSADDDAARQIWMKDARSALEALVAEFDEPGGADDEIDRLRNEVRDLRGFAQAIREWMESNPFNGETLSPASIDKTLSPGRTSICPICYDGR